MKTLIFFAPYNEVCNVASMLDGIALADILIVDDNSTDGTLDLLKVMHRDSLTVLVRPSKQGLGSAHLLAWKHALQHGYEVLVTMDGDHSHDPAEIPRLTAALGDGCDLVIGSRYMVGGGDYTGYRNLHNLLITEVPIHFHERNAGISKIPPLEIFRAIWNLLQLAAICHFTRPRLIRPN